MDSFVGEHATCLLGRHVSTCKTRRVSAGNSEVNLRDSGLMYLSPLRAAGKQYLEVFVVSKKCGGRSADKRNYCVSFCLLFPLGLFDFFHPIYYLRPSMLSPPYY